MSNRYKGGVLSATPPTTSSSAAPGIWTLEQQMQATAGTGWPFGGPFTYIEDVFSTYLYTGTGATQTITNGIDLSTKGGLVWIKARNSVNSSTLFDTARGATNYLFTTSTAAQATAANTLTSFNTTGFSLGTDATIGTVNTSSDTYASWTFREQPKFFDIVTYTGNGSTYQTISHSLASTPGCIIIKGTSGATNWGVYHRSIPTGYLTLNTTNANTAGLGLFQNVGSTSFETAINTNGVTYVAYLFAHNAGGFGLTGSDNVISCGSFTTDGSGNGSISLGYEPQWLLVKESSGTGNWSLLDNMRGLPAGSFTDALLSANLTTAEAATNVAKINATGASFTNYNPSATVIYIAIRRGPMAVPTSGTSVFAPVATTNDGSPATTNFPVDFFWDIKRAGATQNAMTMDRLRGSSVYLATSSTIADTASGSGDAVFTSNTTVTPTFYGTSSVIEAFRRAPGFFDEVCYTGNGTAGTTITHNLGVAPELIICKARTDPGGLSPSWTVGFSFNATTFSYAFLNLTAAATNPAAYAGQSTFPGQPTSSQFTVGTYAGVNYNTGTYVAYLFATCPGVSKVGSYTGTAALLTVNCGFAAGARFVLIKRTDSTGDWYVYDSARGLSSGNDPYLLINSTAAETTGTNYVDTDTTGFKVTAAAPAGLNANGGTYIFLAIA